MSPDQTHTVRHYAKSALNGFGTLDAETAIENAKSDLDAILRCLDRADNAVGVLLVEPINSVVRDKHALSNTQAAE